MEKTSSDDDRHFKNVYLSRNLFNILKNKYISAGRVQLFAVVMRTDYSLADGEAD